jgi:hypothetical protein
VLSGFAKVHPSFKAEILPPNLTSSWRRDIAHRRNGMARKSSRRAIELDSTMLRPGIY